MSLTKKLNLNLFKFIFLIFFILSNSAYSEVRLIKSVVEKVIVTDGDSIKIRKEKIRLHGIDAPETKQKCIKNSKKWNCGLESTRFLKNLVRNDYIECNTNGRDRYNRYIGVCYKNNINFLPISGL